MAEEHGTEVEALWDIEDVARFLKCPMNRNFYGRVKRLGIPCVQVGQWVRFVPGDVRAWVDRQKAS